MSCKNHFSFAYFAQLTKIIRSLVRMSLVIPHSAGFDPLHPSGYSKMADDSESFPSQTIIQCSYCDKTGRFMKLCTQCRAILYWLVYTILEAGFQVVHFYTSNGLRHCSHLFAYRLYNFVIFIIAYRYVLPPYKSNS